MGIVIKLLLNAILIAWGIVFILMALKDRKQTFYYKWFWMLELALGIGNIIYSFTIWFS